MRHSNYIPEIHQRWFKAKLVPTILVEGRPKMEIAYTSARDRVHASKIFTVPGFIVKIKEITYSQLIQDLEK